MINRPEPSNNHPIVELDAPALSRTIHVCELSCREVMQACPAERFNPQVNALVFLGDPEALLAQADHGVLQPAHAHEQ